MQIGFVERENWILPVEGNLGNKAQNLYENTPAILEAGFKVPRSLVIPFEYLKSAQNQTQFVLETIDGYFPQWKRILLRSNSPDEDLGRRFPGLYHSDHLWNSGNDRDYAWHALDRVVSSYLDSAARLRRAQLGLPELGMCLLIMEPVTNTPGEFDADHGGCFSDIGELAVLTFTNPKKGLEGMLTRPQKRLRVDKNGQPVDGAAYRSFNEQEYDLGRRLRTLADRLPQIDGKGWELEFVCSRDGDYIVQTTPITKSGRVAIPDNIDNVFNAKSVVGTGEFSTNGILYIPGFLPHEEKLVEFDRTHKDYCLFTNPANLTLHGGADDSYSNLRFLLNVSVVISLNYGYRHGIPFAQHVQQYMREGRIALDGDFDDNMIFPNVHFETRNRIVGGISRAAIGLLYSPTKLFVAGDEFSQKAVVALDGKVHQFTQLDIL